MIRKAFEIIITLRCLIFKGLKGYTCEMQTRFDRSKIHYRSSVFDHPATLQEAFEDNSTFSFRKIVYMRDDKPKTFIQSHALSCYRIVSKRENRLPSRNKENGINRETETAAITRHEKQNEADKRTIIAFDLSLRISRT